MTTKKYELWFPYLKAQNHSSVSDYFVTKKYNHILFFILYTSKNCLEMFHLALINIELIVHKKTEKKEILFQ